MSIVPSDLATTGWSFSRQSDEVTRYHVVGERSTGTNYVQRTLLMNTRMTFSPDMGWKHGHADVPTIPSDLVVIVALRRADAWARSMFAKPWHTSTDMQMLGFTEFLRAKWETVVDRTGYFADSKVELQTGGALVIDRDPITGEAYDNIFALRRGKMRSHFRLLSRSCNLCFVRCEDVTADPERFMNDFRTAFDLPPPEWAFKPVKKRLGGKFVPAVERERVPPEQLSDEDLAFLREQSDLALETQLGYIY